MKILLVAMPDAASCFDEVMQVPNLGLCSIAAHLEGHDTKVLDLIIHYRRAKSVLLRHLEEFRPDVVGISAMTYQFESAKTAAELVKKFDPRIVTVLGGYHATLLYDEIMDGPGGGLFDCIVRGEGEETFPELMNVLGKKADGLARIAGLSFRDNGRAVHNPARANLDLSRVKLPDRSARLYRRFSFFGLPFDTAETSRGCTMSCGFCSITGMYGRSFRAFPVARVIDDLREIRRSGARGVFFVDDNITLNVPRLRKICGAIVEAGLDDLEYVVQASVTGIVQDPALAAEMGRANFRLVFLGIENALEKNQRALDIENKVSAETTLRAIGLLRDAGITVFGGLITGNPDDTERDVIDTFRYGRSVGADWIGVQALTPYPKTRIRSELIGQGLVTNLDDYARYNGLIANVKTKFLSTRRLNWLLLKEGSKIYFNPFYLLKSRFFRYRRVSPWPLIMNNFKFIASGLRGTIFLSRHRWR
jgi:radical SAM superfamily enzyme YgiQ (UPF0313 family)